MPVDDPYKNIYVSLQFERRGLFELLQKHITPREVLYPGCSVHITLSFYFPHVVYVDQSPQAQAFFTDTAALRAVIDRNKTYHRSAYFRFTPQDYSEPLPYDDGSFDLLISLFAGGIAKSCGRYLKPGGMLLTNNHLHDALEAANDPRYRLTAVIRFRSNKYQWIEQEPGSHRQISHQRISVPRKTFLRQVSTGLVYNEAEEYFCFRRKINFRLSD